MIDGCFLVKWAVDRTVWLEDSFGLRIVALGLPQH